jgi:hypothetical protein
MRLSHGESEYPGYDDESEYLGEGWGGGKVGKVQTIPT